MYTKSTFATHANTAAPVAHHHQQRSNTNRAAANSTSTSTSAAAAPRGAAHGQYTSVYAPGFKYVLNLPQHAIHHLPPASLNVTRLVLCANYDAKAPETSCPMGDRCKFVHADTAAAHEHCIHVNYAWRSLDLVSYERFPAGQVLHVAPPNSKVGSDVMDSDMALKTKALQSTRRPLSHCAHYYFNRTCNLGAECQFIHAVFIDPTAKDHQRAPVPSQLGEGRELQLSKRQREQHQLRAGSSVDDLQSAYAPSAAPTPRTAYAAVSTRSSATAVAARADTVTSPVKDQQHLASLPSSTRSTPVRQATVATDADLYSASPFVSGQAAASMILSAGRLSPAAAASSDDEHDGAGSACNGSVCSANCTSGRVARYRHDPYTLGSSRVIIVAGIA